MLVSTFFLLNGNSFLIPLSKTLNSLCLESLPPSSPYLDIYQALSCGVRLPKGSFKELILKSGLVHLMVVSGAHLVFLERFFNFFISKLKIPWGKFWTFLFLLSFTLICQASPPILRSFFQWNLSHLSLKRAWFWPAHVRVFVSTSFCLLVFPFWWASFSLILSSVSSLIISLGIKRKLLLSFFIYVGLYPFLMYLNPLHPLTIFVVWIFTPFFSLILFPLTLLGSYLHVLTPISDFLWRLTEKGLVLLNGFFELSPLDSSYTSKFLPFFNFWFLFFLFFFTIHIFHYQKKRRELRCF